MKIPLNITFLNIPPSDAIEAEIRKRAQKIDQFANDVMHCHVTVDAAGKHKTQGGMYEVRIDVTLPGTEIAVSHVHRHEDVYVVIRDAFDAAARKLQDHVRLRRGDVKLHEPLLHGQVTRLHEDGYGFIETPDGRELYFHRDNLVNADFDQLAPGMEVQFLEEGAGEGLQAKRVSTGRHQHPGMG
ncbi:HPF/RaiA family ribosome-associated protein [Noviherbaspirillum sedimenti]|uniref:HPF/RaiA family ribosome-associated protein n=2 Tax=Noviherbaspirillum sedimenti TaxID=2320865 RepID=A0A3A3G8T9_9BURK|nr:HPF/RaiA family ribosome-associated protein [Noviherbaspirillum sedimenti]